MSCVYKKITLAAGGFLMLGLLNTTIARADTATPPLAATATAASTNAGTTSADVSQADSLADVPTSSWAYAAVQQLVKDSIITGYPNGTFKGDRPLTRYEMAVAVNRAITFIQRQYEAQKTVSSEDLAAVRKLADYLQNEVKTIEAHLTTLDTRVAAVETQAAATTQQVSAAQQATQAVATSTARAHFSAWLWNRPGVFDQNVVAVNGPIANAAAPANGVLAPGFGAAPAGNAAVGPLNTGGGPGQPNSWVTGNTYRVFDYNDFQLLFNGQLDSQFSYASALEDVIETNSPSGLSLTTPSFCTTVAPSAGGCGVQGATQYAQTFKLTYAYIRYGSPGGFYAKIGRIIQDEGAYNGLQFATGGNQGNGVQLGYTDKRVNAYLMSAFGNSAITNTATSPACPLNFANCSNGGSTLGLTFKADYWFPSTQTAIGGTYDDYSANQMQIWNPAAGLCTNGSTTTSVIPVGAAGACPAYISAPQNGQAFSTPVTGAYQTVTSSVIEPSVFVFQYFGNKKSPQFRAGAELMWRVGNNPLTGTTWNGNRAFNAGITYASKGNLLYGGPQYGNGAKDSNFLDFEYYNNGLNALSVDGSPTGGIGYQYFLFANQQGLQSFLGSAGHWFSNDMKASLVYQYFGNPPGAYIPAGSTTCPGCYIKSMNANSLNLDLMLIF